MKHTFGFTPFPLCPSLLAAISTIIGIWCYYSIVPLRPISATFTPDYVTIQETTLTGNPHWPHKTTLETPQGRFFAYTKQKPLFEYGQTLLTADMVIKTPQKQDFYRYLAKEGALGTVFTGQLSGVPITSKNYSWWGQLQTTRNNLFDRLKRKLSPTTFAFFSALFMGDKPRVKQSLERYKEPFKQWGISHHLARSGLHLVLFIALWQLLISFLPIAFTGKILLIAALSSIYFLLTPTTVSFMRAFELFVCYKVLHLYNQQINPLHLICVVCCIMLFYNPLQLFFLDFQLSFYLTFCLAWLAYLGRQRRFLI